MQKWRPAQSARDRGNRGFVCSKPVLIAFAQGFGALGDIACAVLLIEELYPAIVRQILLGGIEDLKHVAADALAGDPAKNPGNRIRRLEKIAENDKLRVA